MFVSGLRLAGKGLGMLAKPGIGGKIARGVGGTALGYGAFEAAPTVLGAADGSLASDRLEELAGTKPQGGKYKITTQDRLGNVVSDLASKIGIGDGAQVTQGSVKARAQSNREERFKPLFEQYGVTVTPGLSEGAYKNELGKAREAYDKGVTQRSLGYQSGQEEKSYNRGRLEMQYNDNQSKEKIARQDRLASEQNSLNQALAELEFKKGQSNREFDYQDRMLDYKMKERKADRMQKIAMALGGLGQLFAT